MKRIAVVIPSPVEPRLLTQSGDVNDQGIAFPASARPTHPRIRRSLWSRIHTDRAGRACELIRHEDVRARALDDLKRKRHVRRARHAGHVALQFRIAGRMPLLVVADVHFHSLFKVGFLFCQRLRFVRNLPAFDDTLPCGARPIRAHDFRMRSWLGLMILNIPIRSKNKRLPNPVQVGMTVRHARRSVCRKRISGSGLLTRGGYNREPDYDGNGSRDNPGRCGSKAHTHRICPRREISNFVAITREAARSRKRRRLPRLQRGRSSELRFVNGDVRLYFGQNDRVAAVEPRIGDAEWQLDSVDITIIRIVNLCWNAADR